MSTDTGFVLFILNGQHYAIPSDVVEEIVSLPALTVVPDAPRHLAGVFDLHGTIVPVLDLSAWLGAASKRYFLTDNVIVLHDENQTFGIVVNEVTDVCAVFRSQLDAGSVSSAISSRAIAGVVRVDQEMVLLLDRQQLIRLAVSAQGGLESGDRTVSETPLDEGERPFFAKIPAGEESEFRRRALSLMLENGVQDRRGHMPLAVAGLTGEYFGLPLELVKEFAEARNITPVPCCPQHILGNVNLRGEVLTVIDVRPFLKMLVSKSPLKRIIVLEHGGTTVGVGVDEIYEVVYVDPARITTRSLTASSGASGYASGTATYGNHVLTILDLPKLLDSEALVVNEEV